MKQLQRYINSYKFYITVSIAILCFLTTLTSVGFGALNKNLSIAGDVNYQQDMGNMITSWPYSALQRDFHSSTYREKIKTVDFLDNKTIPANAVTTWDVSVNLNTGKVMAWVIDDPNNSGYYKLYIGADGGVVANYDSSYVFCNMKNIIEINFNNNYDTSTATIMTGMFYGCEQLAILDVSSFDTSQVTDMSSMFYAGHSSSALSTITGLNSFDTSKVMNMYNMFGGLESIRMIDISSFDFSNVQNASGLFSCYCYTYSRNLSSALTTIVGLDEMVTSSFTNMSRMFEGLYNITHLDLTHFDTSNVKNMSRMFYGCYGISDLDLSSFNTSQVTDMSNMFRAWTDELPHIISQNFTTLNLSSFNTSNVTNMSGMFYGCDKITNLNINSFNTSNVVNMSNMFAYCKGLTGLNLINFNTSSVTNMSGMFNGCINIPILNLSSFDTSSVTNMNDMFANINLYYDNVGSSNILNSIIVSSKWNVSKVSSSRRMFSSCTNLPNYNSSNVDVSMAKPTTEGGYLTLV